MRPGPKLRGLDGVCTEDQRSHGTTHRGGEQVSILPPNQQVRVGGVGNNSGLFAELALAKSAVPSQWF